MPLYFGPYPHFSWWIFYSSSTNETGMNRR